MPITFTKVDFPYGWLGNMAPFPVMYEGKKWRTTEALFQALRFADSHSHQRIRAKKSPMGAKMTAKAIAKAHPEKLVVERMGRQDLANLKLVLRLKLKQHPELKQQLLDTGDETIIEDSSNRKGLSARFWGAAFKDGHWVGENMLGKVWMKLREELKGKFERKKKQAGKVVAPPSSDDALKTILKVKSWAAEVGGMERLKALAEALSE